MPTWQVLEGDCLQRLRDLPERSVQTVITSPPYFGLRDYGTGRWEGGDPNCDHGSAAASERPASHQSDEVLESWKGSVPQNVQLPAQVRLHKDRAPSKKHAKGVEMTWLRQGAVCPKCWARLVDDQIGLEPTPAEFVEALVAVFRELRRVLRDDGTAWLNIGDSYADHDDHSAKPKDLLGIPWQVAFALRDDGWWLRSDIIWAKPNPMPESIKDRPTRSHEYIFLLSKKARYFYDQDAIRHEPSGHAHPLGIYNNSADGKREAHEYEADGLKGRNAHDVWWISTHPYAGAHFATFPVDLIMPCVLAGTSPKACGKCGAPWARDVKLVGGETTGRTPAQLAYGQEAKLARGMPRYKLGQERIADHVTVGWNPTCEHQDDTGHCVVLDPFSGAGTALMVALRNDRSAIGIELKPEYAEMSRERIRDDAPLFNIDAEVRDVA